MAKKQGTKDTKSFQMIMKPEVHRLLKQRAQQLRVSIGDLIENLLASMEIRVERFKKETQFDRSFRIDELDARLIKLLMHVDKTGLGPEDIKLKLDSIKKEYEDQGYEPKITLDNGTI